VSVKRYFRAWLAPALAPSAVVAVALPAVMTAPAASAEVAAQPPACSTPPATPPPLKPTTITTIEQAYYCVFANYYSGPVLNDQVPLTGAFAGFTQELDRLGLDQPDATMPALTGNRDSDWSAFAAVYDQVLSQAQPTAAQQQDLAAATMKGMIASLDDNHATWSYPQQPPGYQAGDLYGLGILTAPVYLVAGAAPSEMLPPMYVTEVLGGPAASAGLRPGDVIESVNGAPVFVGGTISAAAIAPLAINTYPLPARVTLLLHRPATGRTWTVTLAPALFKTTGTVLSVTSKLLDGDIAYVQFPAFYPGVADQVLAAIASLGEKARLRGVILDLRGNTGGSAAEVATLLGAFEHGTAYAYDCTVTGQCAADYPDASTPLLHLPLVVLNDRSCASGCDAFSGAVKDLHLGTLVGTRTAGIVAGPAAAWVLDDGSILELPAKHEVSADHEFINGIGVAPDYYLPTTAWDVSTGHDPDIAKAIALLRA
jgi:carboxyl-terminal processing protease